MSSFSLSGGVQVFGFISPSDTTDQYPVIDPLYGIDGFRNVNTLTDLNNIPTLRRRAGMVVGVSGGTTYYKLNIPPWNGTITDWSLFNTGNSGGTISGDYLSLSGGTVTGDTIFTNGLTANTFSASTYLGLPSDVYVSGYSYSNNTFTIERSFGNPNLTATINDVTGLTVNGDLSVTGDTTLNGLTATTISAGTYQNLPLDIFVTGGTFSGGVITFINNSGGTFGVSGISSFDTFITGFTYGDNTLTIFQNSGNSFSVLVDTFTGLTINGDLSVTGTTYTDSVSANTYQNLPIDPDTYVTGFSYNNNTFTIGDNSGSTFNVTFNDVTGLTINGDLNVTGTTYTDSISATTYQNLPIDPDTYITGFSYNDNTFTIGDNSGNTFDTTFNDVTGLTINGDLSVTGNTLLEGLTATTISAGTYQNLPLDVFVTGGTYSAGTATFTNNSGGTFNVIGFSTGGGSGTFTGGTVSGATDFTNGLSANTFSATTITGVTIFSSGNTIVGGQFVSLGGTSATSPTYRTSLGGSNLSPRGSFGVEGAGANFHRYSFDPVNQRGLAFTVSNNGSVYIDRASIVGLGISSTIGAETGVLVFNTLNVADNSERMRIDNLGNVGIGTSSPSEKLDIAGKTKTTSIQITSGATNGYVLTSDVSGNGTWQQIPLFTGGTVTGSTNFTNGVTSNTISATTYNNLPFNLTAAASDETTPITTGNTKTTFRMPCGVTLTTVRASLTTAQSSGSTFTVDINQNGSSVLSTKLTIDNTEKTSTTAAIPAVISTTSLTDDSEITIDVDLVGSGTATGLKVTLIGIRV